MSSNASYLTGWVWAEREDGRKYLAAESSSLAKYESLHINTHSHLHSHLPFQEIFQVPSPTFCQNAPRYYHLHPYPRGHSTGISSHSTSKAHSLY